MRYGRQTIFTPSPDGLLVTTEEKFYDWATVQKITRCSESVKVHDTKAALSEFLKLMDQHKAGEVTDFSVECITDKNGRIIRIEKSWVVPDLR